MQFRYLKHDLYRYIYPNNSVSNAGLFRILKTIIFNQGIWALASYRFRRWAIYECRVPVLKEISKFIGAITELIVQVTTGIDIAPGCDIGPGLYIGHFGGIFLPDGVKIGKFCNISQENTFGIAGRGEKRGLPELGDFVYVAPGAKIIGKVTVGNHVAIGANAVVTKSLSDNAVAAGVPAKVISFASSRDFIEFNEHRSREFL